MQAFVFTDRRLERYAGQFVWLQVDVENAKNAAFLQKYPIPAIPTLMVIDPKKESVALRYMSGATVQQMEKLLADGRRAVSPEPASSADGLLVAAEDRKSTRLNSSHLVISYAVFCLKNKNMHLHKCETSEDSSAVVPRQLFDRRGIFAG